MWSDCYIWSVKPLFRLPPHPAPKSSESSSSPSVSATFTTGSKITRDHHHSSSPAGALRFLLLKSPKNFFPPTFTDFLLQPKPPLGTTPSWATRQSVPGSTTSLPEYTSVTVSTQPHLLRRKCLTRSPPFPVWLL
ncbi:hypothetical protein U1Q18_032067 [Sarracenia purpurea var. burkii]